MYYVFLEVLPLVEFYLEEGLSESEAIRLLESPSDDNDSSWTQNIDSNVQSMRLDESSPRPDPFSARIISYDVMLFFMKIFLIFKQVLY